MEKLIAHVDLDAFFASCEQHDHPEFRGKPVVVGARPGGRGVVAAASYEARRFGIHSAMPIGEAYRRCPDAVYVRPNIAHYSAVSRQIVAALESITPVIEKASIDEAYLDISGLHKLTGSPHDIGQRIKAVIKSATGLTGSVGIGPNKLIAKLASDFDKPDGLTVVASDEINNFLDPLPVACLRGNGPVTQKLFRRLGIQTLGELRATPTARLAEQLGERAALSFKRQARGIASAEVVANKQRKSISKERTFQADKSSPAFLRDELTELARAVAATARREGLAGRVVKLKIRFSNFQTLTRQTTLRKSTHDERELRDTAWTLYEQAQFPEQPVRLIGLGLSDWAPTADGQADLFGSTNNPQQSDPKILQAIDAITKRYGANKLQLGVSRKRD